VASAVNPQLPAGTRALVLGFRLALLGLAGGAAALALSISRSRDGAAGTSSARYACPMHPEVTAAGPGQCPICSMELERLKSSDDPAAAAAIDPSTYLHYDMARRRGTGPDAPAPAWVEADGVVTAVIYRDEIDGLVPGARASFFAARAPHAAIALRALPGAPDTEAEDGATARVRFRMDANTEGVPAAGEVGRVRLLDRGRELPVVAESAILHGAEGPYVLVASPDRRTLTPRPIQIGKIFGGMVFVLSGLGPRELVLTRSAFFVDAERRLHQRAAIEVKR
jgi:hypothetical protein